MLDIEAAPLLRENRKRPRHQTFARSPKCLGKEAVEGIVVKITHKPSLLPTRYSLRWVNLSENSLKNVTKLKRRKGQMANLFGKFPDRGPIW